MKGVTSITRKNADGTEVTYWYARVYKKKVSCGKGEEGRIRAELARERYEQDRQLEKMEQLPFREQVREFREKIEQERKFANIKELANWYMGLSTTQKKNSYLRETQALKNLLPYFGKMPEGKLKGSDTVKYRDRRIKQGANDNTVDYELAVLRQVYRLAVKLDEITPDCLPGSFVMNGDVNPRPIVTDEQFELLHKNASPVFADILLCAYESAMRSGEIADLRAKNVHLDVARDMDGDSLSVTSIWAYSTTKQAQREQSPYLIP